MEIDALDLTDLARCLAAGDLSSRAVTEHALDRLDGAGRALNCVVSLFPNEAMSAAAEADEKRSKGTPLGPLHGIPMAHKDLFAVRGHVAAAGSKILTEPSDSTATVISRIEAAGGIYVGSLHMAEFALSPTGYNKHLGYCRNPWNVRQVTGGSSSGSTAAVASGLITGSIGTDTGGSIRVPAAFCGVFGLKPTYSLVSRNGVTPLAPSLDCVGPIARSARDCARLLGVIDGPDPLDPTTAIAPTIDYERALTGDIRGLRIADVSTTRDEPMAEAVRRQMAEVKTILRDLGAKIVPVHLDLEPVNALNKLVINAEAAAGHRIWMTRRAADYSAHVLGRLEAGLLIPATHYYEALSVRQRITQEFVDSAFRNVDILLLPTTPFPAPPISVETDGEPGRGDGRMDDIVRFTRFANYLGLPAISVPAGLDADRLPVGFQFAGRHFEDHLVLKAADAFQRACPPPRLPFKVDQMETVQ